MNKDVDKEKTLNSKLRAISLKDSIWKPGSEGNITITFGYYKKVKSEDINPYVSWSLVGTSCNEEVPSMNLGFIDPPIGSFEFKGKTYTPEKNTIRNYLTNENIDTWIPGGTVLHEFCHALGMLHEHQNNLYGLDLKLNKKAVLDYYKELGYSEEMANTNVLETHENHNEYDGTEFDFDSIMLYYIQDSWLQEPDKNPTKPNLKLSERDILWLQKLYPIQNDTSHYPILHVSFVDKKSPAWKRAWIEKIVTETFNPIIGVKFVFHKKYKKPGVMGKIKEIKEDMCNISNISDIEKDVDVDTCICNQYAKNDKISKDIDDKNIEDNKSEDNKSEDNKSIVNVCSNKNTNQVAIGIILLFIGTVIFTYTYSKNIEP